MDDDWNQPGTTYKLDELISTTGNVAIAYRNAGCSDSDDEVSLSFTQTFQGFSDYEYNSRMYRRSFAPKSFMIL